MCRGWHYKEQRSADGDIPQRFMPGGTCGCQSVRDPRSVDKPNAHFLITRFFALNKNIEDSVTLTAAVGIIPGFLPLM